MTSLINLAFDENGQKAAKIDLSKFKFDKSSVWFNKILRVRFTAPVLSMFTLFINYQTGNVMRSNTLK